MSDGILKLERLNIRPAKTEWTSTGDLIILAGSSGNPILYIEEVTGLICATDGINVAKSPSTYVAQTDHEVTLLFSADGRMRVDMDGAAGQSVDFAGSFSPGETLKWGLENEDMFSIGNVCGTIGLDTLPPIYVTIQGDQLTVQGDPVRIME
jgi:hypothetical protein